MQHTDGNSKSDLKGIAHEALHDMVHFDVKVFRTLPALLFRPGKVTEKSLEAGQTEYVRPFALFVFLNFLFFIIKAKGLFRYALKDYTDPQFVYAAARKAVELHLSPTILEERFNMAMHFEQKEYFIIMVPLFALVMMALYWRRPFTLHMVFALNYYSFFIVYLIVVPYILIPLTMISGVAQFFDSENGLVSLLFSVCLVYLSIALRRVYKQRIWLSLIKGAVLSFTTIALVAFVFRTLLFFIVMHSVSE